MRARSLVLALLGCQVDAGVTLGKQPPFLAALYKEIVSNNTLRRYFQPSELTRDLARNWLPVTAKCAYSDRCHCMHASGESLDIGENAKPEKCEVLVNPGEHQAVKGCVTVHTSKLCGCYTGHGKPCLFGHMSPTKIMLVIAAARASGVRTIIEEGREGGLSAMAYSHRTLHIPAPPYG